LKNNVQNTLGVKNFLTDPVAARDTFWKYRTP